MVPLKMIAGTEIAKEKERPKLTKMKAMMAAVKRGATELGVWPECNGTWEIPVSVRLFESIQHLFNYPSQNGKIRRCSQISWITVHNLYSDFGKKFATEIALGANQNNTGYMGEGLV
jgi:hypothetical protein